jgi:hypothetical protein
VRGGERAPWAPPIGILKGLLLCYFLWRRGSKRRRQEARRRPRHPWSQGQTSSEPLGGIGGPRGGPQVRNPIGMMMQNFRPGYIWDGGVAHAVSRGGSCWRGGKVGHCKSAGRLFSRGFSGPRAVQGAAQDDPPGCCTLALSRIQSLGAVVGHALPSIALLPQQKA